MLTPQTHAKIIEQYDPNFVKNFMGYIAEQTTQMPPQEVMQFANSAYNVAQTIEFMLQKKAGSPNATNLELTVVTTDIRPETIFKKLGLDNQHMFFLMGYLNTGLDTDRKEALDKQIFLSEIERVKTVDDCIKLVYEKYRQILTQSRN